MALTLTTGVTTHSTANSDPYASGLFTPAAGDWLIVRVTTSGTGIIGTLSSSAGLLFDKLVSTTDYSNGQSNFPRHLLVFAAQTMAANSNQTVTFTHGGTPTGASIDVVRVAGFTGAVRRIAQFSSAMGAAGTTPAVAMPAAFLTGNGGIGFLSNGANPATVTPPASWTETFDAGYSTPLVGSERAVRTSGETGSTITWGSTSGTAWAAAVVEIMETGIASPLYYARNSLQGMNA
jgi:hypothetical protein